MILDRENLFSLDQAVTTTAASDLVIDFGSDRDVGAGEPLALFVHVTEAFTGTGTLTVILETSSDGTFAGDVELVRSVAYDDEALSLGARLLPIRLPRGVNRHLRLTYLVTGAAFSAGTVKAGLARALQDKKTYPSAIENLA